MGKIVEIDSLDEMCDNKIPETVKKHCKHEDCAYRGHISPINQSTDECCDYLILTGHSRGCPISTCDKYKKGRRKMTKTSSMTFVWGVEEDELSEV